MKPSFSVYLNKLGILALLLIFSFSCSEEEISEENLSEEKTSEQNVSRNSNNKIKGEYVIVVSKQPAVGNSVSQQVLSDLSNEIQNMAGGKVNRVYKHVFAGFAATLTDKQVERLRQDKRIESVVSDEMVYLNSEVQTQASPTWGLDRVDQREKFLDRTYAYNATGAGVTAYIIDSGINYDHEEFNGRASNGYDFVLEAEPESTNPDQLPGYDCIGHGTHVAGTVGGQTYGVAKEIDLVSVRVFGCKGSTTWSIVISAVEWVTANAIKPAVVNMSLGDVIYEPIDIAVENSIATGISYIISAGNSRGDACLYSPAHVESAITVGATTIYDEIAYFSNFGDCVDIYAPGKDIVSASHLDNTSVTTKSGTSMAAPHTAGVAALYLQNYPEALPLEVETAIKSNSTLINHHTGDFIALYSKFEEFGFTPTPAPDIALKAYGEKIKGEHKVTLDWVPTGTEGVRIYIDDQLYATTENDGQYIFQARVNSGAVFKVCETSYANCSESGFIIDGGNEPNNIHPISSFSISYSSDKQAQFTDLSTDEDGTIASWHWDFGDGLTSTVQNPAHLYSNYYDYLVTLTVTDNDGAETSSWGYARITEAGSPPYNLTAIGYKVQGKLNVDLKWTASDMADTVNIYRGNNVLVATVTNTGSYTDKTNIKGSGTIPYWVCSEGSTYECTEGVQVNY